MEDHYNKDGDRIKLDDIINVNISDSNLEEKLESRKEKYLSIFGPLFSHISTNLKTSNPDEIFSKINKTTNEISELKIENKTLKSKNDNLNNDIEILNQKLKDLIRRQERDKSKTLQRIKEDSMINGKSDNELTSENNKSHSETNNKSSSNLTNEEKDELEKELNQLRGTNKTQKQQLMEQDDIVAQLRKDMTELSVKIRNPSNIDMESTSLFKNLQYNLTLANREIDDLKNLRDSLMTENGNFESQRESFKTELDKQLRAQKEDLTKQLERSENDLSRIRSARDELLAQISVLKSTSDSRVKSFEELKALNQILNDKLSSMEELRITPRNNNNEGETETPLDSLSLEQLKEKVGGLERRNESLAKEIPVLEEAFKRANLQAQRKIDGIVDKEAYIVKLQTEKSKADQKYFAAMRSKDALTNENKVLKQQISKGGELIQQLKESEKLKSDKVAILEAQISEMKRAHMVYQKEVQDSQRKLVEQRNNLNGVTKTIEMYQNEIKKQEELYKNEARSRREQQVEIVKLEKQVDIKNMTSSKRNGSIDGEQLDALRAIALCSVCGKNWKDTALKVCGHAFCLDCAQERLTSRLRRCPVCNSQYSQSDLLAIHL